MLKFNMKNLYIAIGSILFFIVILASPSKAYALPTYLTVREAPNSSEIVFTLERGQVVSILKNDGEFVRVRKNGLIGWTRGIYLLDTNGFRLYDKEIGVSREECPTCWITNRTWFTPSPRHFRGKATFYAPNVMEAQVARVARNLGLNPDDYVGGVATASASDIGKTVWLKRENSIVWEGPYLIADVSQRNHAWGHVGVLGQAVEVDYRTAVRWGMATTGSGWRVLRGSLPDVQVYKGKFPIAGVPVDYQKWYRDMAEFALPRQPNWQWSPLYYFLGN